MKHSLTAVTLTLLFMVTTSGTVSAQATVQTPLSDNSLDKLLSLDLLPTDRPTLIKLTEKPKPEKQLPKPEPTKYTIREGDSLSKIAIAHNTTWLRLWQKNTQLTSPDTLNIGVDIIVPTNDEVLTDRPIPQPPTPQTPVREPVNASYTGNGYDYGYCVWYAKTRRPDLPNNLGNANTWYSRASSMGLSVGSTPRVGAIGTTTSGSFGHAVYVENINPDGTITISEMNYKGWNIQSSRVVNANSFRYIY